MNNGAISAYRLYIVYKSAHQTGLRNASLQLVKFDRKRSYRKNINLLAIFD